RMSYARVVILTPLPEAPVARPQRFPVVHLASTVGPRRVHALFVLSMRRTHDFHREERTVRGSITRKLATLVAMATLPAALVPAPASAKTTSTTPRLAVTTLNGSGSSLQLGFDQVAIGDFKKLQPGVTINYASIGSGSGRSQFAGQVTDFAGSDAPF